MTRLLVELPVADTSSFAKSLRKLLQTHHAETSTLPSHVELLNMLARAAGFRNIQMLKARAERTVHKLDKLTITTEAKPGSFNARMEDARLAAKLHTPSKETHPELSEAARKALGLFDAEGKLIKLPSKFSVQRLAMWPLWARFESNKRYTEKQVNEVLKAHHNFGDHATLRRELINMQLLARKDDCSEYWKLEPSPPLEAQGLLKALQVT